jgi:hypothetical protein
MLLKVDFGALHEVRSHWKGIGVTVFINWAVKPFSMALLGWLFISNFFADYLPAGQIDSYIAGLIILAAAPCTAMVFVWSNLTDQLHFESGGLERRHHDFRVRAYCRSSVGTLIHHRPLGNVVPVRGALYSHSRHRGAFLAKRIGK